jgi:hypothetical protein
LQVIEGSVTHSYHICVKGYQSVALVERYRPFALYGRVDGEISHRSFGKEGSGVRQELSGNPSPSMIFVNHQA